MKLKLPKLWFEDLPHWIERDGKYKNLYVRIPPSSIKQCTIYKYSSIKDPWNNDQPSWHFEKSCLLKLDDIV